VSDATRIVNVTPSYRVRSLVAEYEIENLTPAYRAIGRAVEVAAADVDPLAILWNDGTAVLWTDATEILWNA